MIPKTNRDFWVNKLSATKERDDKNNSELKQAGWDVINLWECNIEKDLDGSVKAVISALG